MSYSMMVFEGAAPRSDEEAIAAYGSMIERYEDGEAVEPTPAIRAYVEAVLGRWPDITDDEGEDSPWADGPLINDASGPMFHFALVFSSVEESIPFIVAEAERRNLVCVDPQGPPFVLAPAGRGLPSDVQWRDDGGGILGAVRRLFGRG
jgi:hypothetical protein